jgi:Lon-like ATP-dependent protease
MSYNIVTNQISNYEIKSTDLKEYIGLPIFSEKKMYEGIPPPGIMIGLAYNSYGGNILYIETIKSNFESAIASESKTDMSGRISRKGMIKLTGSLGDVMQESV